MEQIFFSDSITAQSIILEDQEAAHCSLVLRKKNGDLIFCIDGKGGIYKALIEQIGKHRVECRILEHQHYDQVEKLHLAVAPTKNRDRLEWLVEKVVEIGIKRLIFVNSERTERSKINMERIQKKMLSAVKQSKRYYLPEVLELGFDDLLALDIPRKYIAHCEDSQDKKSVDFNYQESLIAIGPEGDFTPQEIEMALSKGFNGLDLGEFRLRTETAALVAAAHFNS
ncbi:16S rRNA (uracil(1498)-N(3))-methyltransferase [bacterium]|nr:16S rRNA (uracil(1498)-N(3))-methyltransferase [bacterium]